MLTALALTGLILAGLTLVGLFPGGPGATAANAAPSPAASLPEPFQQGPDDTGGPLRLDLTQLSPRVVTSTGPSTLTFSGTLTNTGDQPIDDLVIRMQRGNALQTEGAVRDALDGDGRADAITPQFTPIPGELAPRGQMPVRLTVPLRGAPDSTLALAETGVHELLVNVNGVPRDGRRARLAAVRMLLPVISLPPGPGRAGPVAPPPPPPATPFSMLFPITDTPRRVSTVPGEPTLLTDDDLAASMAPGGRLGSLVAALAADAPPGSRVRAATCLAIDPDLVETASLMRAGYQVQQPGGGPPVPGTGAAAAGQWLDSLAAVAKGGCVMALPYADADLVALTRGGLGELADPDHPRRSPDPLRHPRRPRHARGHLAGRRGRGRRHAGRDRVGRRSLGAAVRGRRGPGPGAAPQRRGAPRGRPPATVRGADRPAAHPCRRRAQRRIGSGSQHRRSGGIDHSCGDGRRAVHSGPDRRARLPYRGRPDRRGPTAPAGPLVLAPPHQWAVEGNGAAALLTTVNQLIGEGRIVPSALDGVLAAGPSAGTAPLAPAYPLRSGGLETPTGAVDIVRKTAQEIEDLSSAAVPDSGVGASPEEAFGPLRRGLARPVSAAWRGRPAAAVAAADAAAAAGGGATCLGAGARAAQPVLARHVGRTDPDHRGQRAAGHGRGQRPDPALRGPTGGADPAAAGTPAGAATDPGQCRGDPLGPVHRPGSRAHPERGTARTT